MKASPEQRAALAETIRMLVSTGTPFEGIAQIVWEHVSVQVLEAAKVEWLEDAGQPRAYPWPCRHGVCRHEPACMPR